MEVIAKTEGLKKYYGEGAGLVKALDGIDLEIEKGRFTVIVGTSGSGKTTLLNLLGGQDRPTEGNIWVEGARIDALKESQLAVYRRNKMGFVYQNFNLIPMLTVEENILFPLDMGNERPDRAFLRSWWRRWDLGTGCRLCPGNCPEARGSRQLSPGLSLPGRPLSWRTSPQEIWIQGQATM